MFFPDIKFYDGVPGESGMDAVVAGCQKLIDDGYIDKDKIALHGHSWSGYQSAFFATQTDFFTAVVTGAPVANMTSAYSGIRLGSGMARQFQYEQMQSRIGGNIIDSLDAYIANSPIFFADKMNTPMLIMFGDIDDAVPWQQGIELYLACRRFEKPCIMLQYEKEPHHLKKYPNKLDYTIKMKQFFDHYVLGKPAENWILEGMEYKGKPQTMKVEKIK
jgi:dipeptidyl aminopeptidase/acylaminoacyl peptidase